MSINKSDKEISHVIIDNSQGKSEKVVGSSTDTLGNYFSIFNK